MLLERGQRRILDRQIIIWFVNKQNILQQKLGLNDALISSPQFTWVEKKRWEIR